MKQVAKKVTIGILISAFAVGSVGAFIAIFNMDGYINFLRAFSPIYISLIASIGANSAVKTIQEKKNV